MTSKRPLRPLIVVVGPTGTGKSQLAISLAQRFNGEIINDDALQMYNGLPITTNKVSLEERKGIPHHLLDCVKLEEPSWTVRQFNERANQLIKEINEREKLPILVGGTHYYTQSILFPKSLLRAGDGETTAAEDTIEEEKWPVLSASPEEMLEELRKHDPRIAQRWHPNEGRKIRRSLQIYLQTGKRASDLYDEQSRDKSPGLSLENDVSAANLNLEDLSQRSYEPLIFWMHTEHEELCKRLDQRVDTMISGGLLDEARAMNRYVQVAEAKGVKVDLTRGIWIAIGFKEMLPYISISGQQNDDNIVDKEVEWTLAQGTEDMKAATRQYAKRQARWIRRTLLPAAHKAGFSSRVFLLDVPASASDPREAETVAGKITEAFLEGNAEQLPDPTTLSEAAGRMLAVVEEKEESVARHCETCNKTLMSEQMWTAHVRTKGHKKASAPKVDWRALYPKT